MIRHFKNVSEIRKPEYVEIVTYLKEDNFTIVLDNGSFVYNVKQVLYEYYKDGGYSFSTGEYVNDDINEFFNKNTNCTNRELDVSVQGLTYFNYHSFCRNKIIISSVESRGGTNIQW